MDSGCIQLTACHVAKNQSTPTTPAAVKHASGGVVGDFLNHWENTWVAGAQVVLSERNGRRSEDPGFKQNFVFVFVLFDNLFNPAANVLEIAFISGGEQEGHAEAVEGFPALGIEVIAPLGLHPLRHIANDLV